MPAHVLFTENISRGLDRFDLIVGDLLAPETPGHRQTLRIERIAKQDVTDQQIKEDEAEEGGDAKKYSENGLTDLDLNNVQNRQH